MSLSRVIDYNIPIFNTEIDIPVYAATKRAIIESVFIIFGGDAPKTAVNYTTISVFNKTKSETLFQLTTDINNPESVEIVGGEIYGFSNEEDWANVDEEDVVNLIKDDNAAPVGVGGTVLLISERRY